MKTKQGSRQKEIAEWLGLKQATFSNILAGRRWPSRDEALRLEWLTGISFPDWMLSDRNLLKKKIMIAYYMRPQGEDAKW